MDKTNFIFSSVKLFSLIKENAYFDLKEKIKKYENKLVELEDDRDHFRDQFVEQTERCREQNLDHINQWLRLSTYQRIVHLGMGTNCWFPL